jgi:hypothetical protein
MMALLSVGTNASLERPIWSIPSWIGSLSPSCLGRFRRFLFAEVVFVVYLGRGAPCPISKVLDDMRLINLSRRQHSGLGRLSQ